MKTSVMWKQVRPQAADCTSVWGTAELAEPVSTCLNLSQPVSLMAVQFQI